MNQQNEIAKMIRNDYARVKWYELKIKISNHCSFLVELVKHKSMHLFYKMLK